MKVFVLKEHFSFKPGQVVEADFIEEGNARIDEVVLDKDSFILLNEALTPKDEEKIKEIIKDVLKKVFWRIYTRNSFILQ